MNESLGPRERESRKLELNKQVEHLLSSGSSVAKIAEILGAENYLKTEQEKNRPPVTTFDVKNFIKDEADKSEPLKLPDEILFIEKTILPPGEGKAEIGSGEGFERIEHIQRTKFLSEVLTELNLSYSVVSGKNARGMMRQLGYVIFLVPERHKIIFVNNEENNATFVIHQVDDVKEWQNLFSSTKDQLKDSDNEQPTTSVRWSGNADEWKQEIQDLIMTENPPIKKTPEGPPATDYEFAPDGWESIGGLHAKFISQGKKNAVGRKSIVAISNEFRDEKHADWFKKYRTRRTESGGDNKRASGGFVTDFIHPDLVKIIMERVAEGERVPAGWYTKLKLRKELDCNVATIDRLVGKYRNGEHPEWFGQYINPDKSYSTDEYYAPAFVDILKKTIGEKAPEGWRSREFIRTLKRSYKTFDKMVETFRATNPDWFKFYRTKKGGGKGTEGLPVEHFSLELLAKVKEISEKMEQEVAPAGWYTNGNLAQQIGRDPSTVKNESDKYRNGKRGEEWFKNFRDKVGKIAEHYHPDLVAKIIESIGRIQAAEEGWYNASQIVRKCESSYNTITDIADSYRASHPEWFKICLGGAENKKSGRVSEFYHPDLVSIIMAGRGEKKQYKPRTHS